MRFTEQHYRKTALIAGAMLVEVLPIAGVTAIAVGDWRIVVPFALLVLAHLVLANLEKNSLEKQARRARLREGG